MHRAALAPELALTFGRLQGRLRVSSAPTEFIIATESIQDNPHLRSGRRPIRVAAGALALLTLFSVPAAAEMIPERFRGELHLCAKVANALKQDKTVEEALISAILFYANQPEEVYRSVQRALIYDAIRTCHYDGRVVLRAGLRLDMSLPLLTTSLHDAGVAPDVVRAALLAAGLSETTIDQAMASSDLLPLSTNEDLTERLVPSLQLIGGLGQLGQPAASPFVP